MAHSVRQAGNRSAGTGPFRMAPRPCEIALRSHSSAHGSVRLARWTKPDAVDGVVYDGARCWAANQINPRPGGGLLDTTGQRSLCSAQSMRGVEAGENPARSRHCDWFVC